MEIFEEQKEIVMNKRLSLVRKVGSDFDAVNYSKSTKCLETKNSLNTTVIVSSDRLATIVEPPRISSGRKIIGNKKDKEKDKDVKAFLFKSKEIKNSIVQKV